ncbi:SPOR domain-containing protein [Marinimicrobium sp. ABcell2]|uniref:SPOR domain-containing protein n=1 Tax=Marinimicrobium sp. ABcell2 TaxID=3069751 RepID=UPI0027B0B030|nr:SPOR domain-containing protein [Marinimicrobium sp. ABcell2]MDQ2075538.1 SPOR domain-containing protein [Marinimicrobium sp. ABcell2]
MKDGLKQRLVGAFVLAAVAVIFLPSLLREQQPEPVDTRTQIPDRPAIESMSFSVPEQPQDIEPAPAPETMFVPEESSQPVAESLDDLSESPSARETTESEVERAVSSTSSAAGEAPERAAWVIQVASLRSADSANQLRDRLQNQGYKAYVRTVSVNGSDVSRVYIGPKLDRTAAEGIKADIDRELHVDALILRFQP